MPFYRYQCDGCGAKFKVLQQNGDQPIATCPECGQETTCRLAPRVGVIYKGGGYYTTDRRTGKRTGT